MKTKPAKRTRLDRALKIGLGDALRITLALGRLEDRLAELGNRMQQIESDIEKIQIHLGRVAIRKMPDPPALAGYAGPFVNPGPFVLG